METADKKYIEQRNNTLFTSVSARSANAYQRVSIDAGIAQADPHQLIQMLFDGLLNNVGAARGALARGDIKAKCHHISIAVRILEEGLKGGLNLADGGELAANLQNVYDYCALRLTLANARSDDDILQEVSRVIAPIADGWKQIAGTRPAGTRLM